MDIDYNSLSLDELREIYKKSGQAIESFEARKRKDAISQAIAIAREAGFSSLEEMLSAAPAKKPVEPKYRHPENPELTWSGRGRKPRWIVDSGRPLEDFAI